ncbi:MAG: proline iminopeptidase, partial [Paraglaciecola sp.]
MSEIYPAIKPFHTQMLPVSDLHTVYLEQTGNPKGMPVLYLHGGPGAGTSADYRRFFDPDKYWIIGFDQRGCGKSLPFGELKHNTSDELLSDIRKIRRHLKIEKWLLFGGSWGTTLALLSAIDQPEYVSGLILRGIFLGREEDFDWYLDPSGGAAQFFNDYYQDFVQPVSHSIGSKEIVEDYYRLLTSNDEVSKMAAVKAWCLWEARI